MPEGPSIVILKEAVAAFKGKKILSATGNTKVDKEGMTGQKVITFKSWGKHFLICLPGLTVRIHFLLFGSYSINEQIKPNPRLHLKFSNGDLYFYTCSVKIVTEPVDEIYDWSADVMNDSWSAAKAKKKLKALPGMLVCDALLNQDIFAGVGNIIKNEVLFRIKVHPESEVGALPPRKLTEMITEARLYSFDFLKWKKAFELRKNWLAHTKTICPRDHVPFIRVRHLGKTRRRAFYCEVCQILYKRAAVPIRSSGRGSSVAGVK
ncbi:MAG TPA: DNA-formamidopyrimidine glycosylase family protein [Puia sp.]|nr:DNA-formamidopyrimidine glycosylase family protein [Puia sp.]